MEIGELFDGSLKEPNGDDAFTGRPTSGITAAASPRAEVSRKLRREVGFLMWFSSIRWS
jgi:hypothetical protein